jgi:hypothetical protein
LSGGDSGRCDEDQTGENEKARAHFGAGVAGVAGVAGGLKWWSGRAKLRLSRYKLTSSVRDGALEYWTIRFVTPELLLLSALNAEEFNFEDKR